MRGDWLRKIQDGVRLGVVMTAVPPFDWCYRQIYWLAIHLTVWRLKRVPGIRTINLRRGCARGEILPGVSDVDFGIVAEKWAIPQVRQVYNRCSRQFLVVDSSTELNPPEDFQEAYQYHFSRHFRANDGRKNWIRLYGEDAFATLPPPVPEYLRWGQYLDSSFWWTTFATRVLPTPHTRWEQLESTALCYKSVAEVVKAYHHLQTGEYHPKRREGLIGGMSLLDVEGQALAERLLAHERSRFLRSDSTLRADTYRFLLRFLDQRHGDPASLPDWQACRSLPLQPDTEGWKLLPPEYALIHQLTEQACAEWEGFQGAALTPSLLYEVEEFVLFLRVAPECPPTQAQVTRLVEQARHDCQHRPRRFHIALQMQNVAPRLFCWLQGSSLTQTRQYFRGLLSPALNPDAYLLMARPEHILQGTPLPPSLPPPVWTLYQEFYLLHWRSQLFLENTRALIETPAPTHSTLNFLRYWWKGLQLIAIERAVRRGEAILPLSLPAIRHALDREGVPFPDTLLPLEQAFQSELANQKADITALIPAALDYLRTINAQMLAEGGTL